MRSIARTTWLLAAILVLMAVSPAPSWATPHNQLKYFFINTGVQGAAEGKVLFVSNKAQSFFTIKTSHMTPGTYDVVVNGAIVDTLTVDATGSGSVTHRTKVKKNGGPLPYDPRGSILSVQTTGIDLLTATVPATPAEAQAKIQFTTDLANLGVIAGSGEATFQSRFGRMQFRVEVEDMPEGVYDLMVGGVKVGEIAVDATGRGEIDFDSRPSSDDDDPGLDLPLTFDPRGQTLSVEQSGVSQLSATLPLL